VERGYIWKKKKKEKKKLRGGEEGGLRKDDRSAEAIHWHQMEK